MASLSDYRLAQQIRLGQGEALGQLFDRYADSVYDFLVIVTGDSDTSTRLLTEVFTRLPQTIPAIHEHETVAGVLLGLARETALTWARQQGCFDALPPSTMSAEYFPALVNDIWQAARLMPANQRAVLALEEHQALSPTEKAVALGVMRNQVADLVAEARRTFTYLFDSQARATGKPTAESVNPDHIPGIQRQVADPGVSLFTCLPKFTLADTVRLQIQSQIVQTMNPPIAARREAAVAPSSTKNVATVPRYSTAMLVTIAMGFLFLSVLLVAFLGFGGAQPTPTVDTLNPIIEQVEPPAGATLPADKRVLIQAIYRDDQKIDVKTVRLILDGRDMTVLSTVSDSSISYAANLDPGQHIAIVELNDLFGNRSTRKWEFAISAAMATLSPVPSRTNVPTAIPLPTLTSLPTLTPLPTATRLPTLTPLPTATQTPKPALPDLVVTNIALTPNNEILYSIRNIGEGDVVAPFLIQVQVDGVTVDSHRRISTLGAGQEVSLHVPNYYFSATRSVTVIVNSDQTIRESNTQNNSLTRTLVGPPPTATPTPTVTPSPTPTPQP